MDGPTLEITAGFHSGVARKLSKRHYRIGSAPGADIVLRDPGVEPEHAVLRAERYGARIEATGGDVGMGAETLAKGHGCRLRYPFELSLGQARIRLTGTAQPDFFQTAGELITTRPRMAGGAAIACILLLVLISGRQGDTHTVVASPQAAPKAEAVSVADASRSLNEHLNEAGIQGLKITTVDNRLAVSGIIPASALGSWTAVQQWFDNTYKGRIVLTASVAVGEGKNLSSKVRLAAVWFGEHPYLITDDGVRRYPGSPLPDGWLIGEIRDNRVTLAKDGQTVTLTYR